LPYGLSTSSISQSKFEYSADLSFASIWLVEADSSVIESIQICPYEEALNRIDRLSEEPDSFCS
jgi:hypothetical protein